MSRNPCVGFNLLYSCSHVLTSPISQCNENPCPHTCTWPSRNIDSFCPYCSCTKCKCTKCEDQINEEVSIVEAHGGEKDFETTDPQLQEKKALEEGLETLGKIRDNSQGVLYRSSSVLAEKTLKELDTVLKDLLDQFLLRVALREKIQDRIKAQLAADEGMEKRLKKILIVVRAIVAALAFEKVLDTVEALEDDLGKAERYDGKNSKQSEDEKSDETQIGEDLKNADDDAKFGEGCDGEEIESSGEEGKPDIDLLDCTETLSES